MVDFTALRKKTKEAKYKIKNRLTLPVLSFKNRASVAVKITGDINKSEKSYIDGAGKEKKLGHTCKVINLDDGIEYQLILTKVSSSILTEIGDYVGKCFLIEATPDKLPGKDYKGIQISEIEDPLDYTNIEIDDPLDSGESTQNTSSD